MSIIEVGRKYRIIKPEEHFIDQDGNEDYFEEVTWRVGVLEYCTQGLPSGGDYVLVMCLEEDEVFPLPVDETYLIEEINNV